MNKVSSLKEKDKQSLQNELKAKASMLGFDAYDNITNHVQTSEFGLCNDCKYLQLAKSEFRTIFARCYEFEIKLNNVEKITECTSYEQRNTMTLNEMRDIAYIIDIDTKKLGF
jgi:hypothetical protein